MERTISDFTIFFVSIRTFLGRRVGPIDEHGKEGNRIIIRGGWDGLRDRWIEITRVSIR